MTTSQSQISFKFKNEKNYDSIKFFGQSLTLKDLKNKIKSKLQQTKSNSGPSKEKDTDDLIVKDEQTQQTLIDDNFLIQSDKKLIIERKTVSSMPMRQDYQYHKPSFPYNTNPPPANDRSNLDSSHVQFKEIEKYLVDAKYFMIKSSNYTNIKKSINFCEWATTKSNEGKLNTAFNSCKNVILLFSVNKSSHFQGYARMDTISTNKMVNWQDSDSIKLGGCFKVKWLRTCNVNFNRISHFKNKFNNNEPIKKSRDTQEIPPDVGYEIIKMFENPDRDIPLALMESQDALNRGYTGFGMGDNESSDESESVSAEKLKSDECGDTPRKEIKEETKEQKPEKKINLFEGINLGGFDFGDGFDEAPQEEKKSEPPKIEPPKVQETEIIPERPIDTALELNSNSRDGEASKGEESNKSDPEKPTTMTTPPPTIQETLQNKPPEVVPRIQENRPPPPVINNFPPQYPFNPGYPNMPYNPYNRMTPMMPPGNMGMNNMNPYYGYNYPPQPMYGGYQQKPMPGGYIPPPQDENRSDYDSDDEDRDRKKNKKKSKKKKKRRSGSRSRSRSHSKSRRN